MNKNTLWEKIKAVIDLARPMSSTKNLAIVLLVMILTENFQIIPAAKIFLAMSLVCSAMYALNSWSDKKIDKYNANKNNLADSAEKFSKTSLITLIIILLSFGLFIGQSFPWQTNAALAAIFVTAYFYSFPPFRFKEKIYLDVIFGAVLTFALRFIAAWYALGNTPPPLFAIALAAIIKTGNYLSYKLLDLSALQTLKIKNTITHFSRKQIYFFSVFCQTISLVIVTLMTLNDKLKLPYLGTLPRPIIYLIPLVILAMVIYQRQTTKPFASYAVMRRIGFTIIIITCLIIWFLL